MSNTGVNSRELIANMLVSISKQEEYSHILIRDVLDKYDYLDTKEKAFIKCITDGCVERQIEIDYIIDSFSKTPVKKMKPFIKAIMRMSVYQIVFMDKVPDSAAINEAVKLAKKKGFSGLTGFVNGVLRNVSRGIGDIKYPDFKKDAMKARSVKYSMPEWIIEELDRTVGEEKADQTMAAFLEPRPVLVRFSERLSEKECEELAERIKKADIEIEKHPYGDRVYTLSRVPGASNLPGFMEGMLTIQDASSILAVMAAGIKKGDFVIDVCAAPGGKTAYAAELAGTEGRVISRDLTQYKTSQIEDVKERMHLSNITIQEWDARIEDESLVGKADVVIADLPCLGLGVIGRKKDIKFRSSKEQLEELAKLQREILQTVSKYVKPGGCILFSTCSITTSENKENSDFILKELGFKPADLSGFLPGAVIEAAKANKDFEMLEKGRLQLLPGIYDCDGFYIARFVRE